MKKPSNFNKICLLKEWEVKANLLRKCKIWAEMFYWLNIFKNYSIIKLLQTQQK